MTNPAFSGRRVALVVAGGGARGAYAAGCLSRLAEEGFEPCACSGTSIGALTVGVLAGNRNFRAGAEAAGRFWDLLSTRSPLGSYRLDVAARALLSGADGPAIFDDRPIVDAVRDFVDPSAVAAAPRTWITVTELLRPNGSLLWALVAKRHAPRWIELQALAKEQVHDYLLASAAIPFALPSRKVAGAALVDGGLVDNTPVLPLTSLRPDMIVVVKLEHGSSWWRGEFADQAILEISPSKPVQKDSGLRAWAESLLDFSPSKIAYLREMGYADAGRALRAYADWRVTSDLLRTQQDDLLDSTERMLAAGNRLLGDNKS